MAALSSSNDLFANGLGNGDDFRTATLGGHLRLGGLVLAADAAMLTAREDGTRSDEGVAVVGWAVGRVTPRTGWHAGGFIGGGVRVDGELGGAELQNGIHNTFGIAEVDLDYEQTDTVRPVLTSSAVAGWLGPAGLGLTGWWGGQLIASGQWAVEGEAIAELGPRVCLVGQQGALWAGLRYRWRDGDAGSRSAELTGVHEDGWWLDVGTFVVPFGQGDGTWGYGLRSGFNPETRAAFGSIGVVVAAGVSPAAPELALEHDVAVYEGGGFGVQLRWHPWAYQDAGRRSAAVFDYRFGTQPDGRLTIDIGPGFTPLAADLRHDQVTVGWEEGLRSPDWSGLRFVPWVQAGAGARQEGVVVENIGSHSTGGQATTMVVRGAVGLRLVRGDLVSVGASLDGWLPAWQEELRTGNERTTLNAPGWAVGLHAAAHISW